MEKEAEDMGTFITEIISSFLDLFLLPMLGLGLLDESKK